MRFIALSLLLACPLAAQQINPATDVRWPTCGAGTAYAPASNTCVSVGEVPSGMIAFIATGTCPTGWTENDSLAGYNVAVVTSASGNVGKYASQSLTAGAQTFTGSTTTVPAETVNSLTAAAQVFTGTSNQTTSATSAGTPAGTNSGGAFSEGPISWPGGVPTNAGGAFAEGLIAWPTGGSNVPTFSGSSGTVPAETFTGSLDTTSGTSAGTPAGTNSGGAFSIVTTHENSGSSNYVATTMGGTSLASGTTSITLSTQPTFAGSAMATHTHTVTPTGSNGTVSFTPAGTIAWPTPVPTITAGTFTQPTISWPAGVPTIGVGTFTQPNFAGAALGTHTHTLTPAGTNGSSAVTGTLNSTTITPLGSNGLSAVSGNAAYYNVIACQKN